MRTKALAQFVAHPAGFLGLAVALVVFATLLSACGSSLSEKDVQSRIDASITKAVAGLPTPAPLPNVLKAERFEVVGKDGKVRAFLSILEDGRPTLALLDDKGELRAWLFLSADGSPRLVLSHKGLLVLTDAKGEFRSLLRLDQAGSPTLALSDGAGNIRSVLGLGEDGSPTLVLRDKEGKIIWFAPVAGAPSP